jgi:hypothetical protein
VSRSLFWSLATIALCHVACTAEPETETAAVSSLALTAPASVSLTVEPADDFVYITVNGVRREVIARSALAAMDVTSWFVAGTNSVRVQVFNTGGPASYALSLARNAVPLIVERNPAAEPRLGLVFDRTYQIALPGLPPSAALTVSGTTGARIYLNDAYTGKTVPSSFELPAGAYRVGVGVGETNAGAYYEEVAELSAGGSLVLTPTAAEPVRPHITRVAILPIRTTYHGGTERANTGVLTQADIDTLRGQAEATSRAWVEPYSYGLTRWEVSVLDTVESTPLQRAAAADSGPDTARLLREAGLTELEQRYDSIVYLYSELTDDGTPVQNGPCCFWGWGQMVAFQNGMLRNGSDSEPNVYLLHEMLHDYEAFQTERLGYYNGQSGVHGAESHGYPRAADGELDFLKFYRAFMRGQVAEVAGMQDGVPWTGPLPDAPDAWIGVFETMREGVAW